MKLWILPFIIASVFGACFDEREVVAYRRCERDAGDCKCAFIHDGTGFCTVFCEVEDDCPAPYSATATPLCASPAELKIPGDTGICVLLCDENEDCPGYPGHMACSDEAAPGRKICTANAKVP